MSGNGDVSSTACTTATLTDMKRIVMGLRILGFALILSLKLLTADPLPYPQQESCPDTVDTIGRYVNGSYGFSIVIPEDLRGTWNSARCVGGKDGCVCMSDHGRIIPLASDSAERDHWIEAYAGFATDIDEPTSEEAVKKRLEWIRERSRKGSVSVLNRSSIVLAGLKGQRVVVRYYDRETRRMMMEDFVELLRGRKEVDVEYSLYLRAPVATYRRDKASFEAVLRTFELGDCDNC